MFIAYVKSIEVGTTLEGVQFTEIKNRYNDNIVFLNKSPKGTEWYVLNGTKILFHSTWLENITEVDEYHGVLGLSINNMSYYRIVYRNPDREFFDIKSSNHRVARSPQSWFNSNNIDDFGSNTVGPCLKNETFVCRKCKEVIHKSCAEKGLKDVCIECFLKHRKSCNICGNDFIVEDKNRVLYRGSKIYACDECLSNSRKCDKCGADVIKNDYVNVEGDIYCTSCYEKNSKSIVSCDTCGNYFYEGSKNLSRDKHGEYRCSVCLFTKRFNSGINGYSFKPEPVFFGDRDVDNLFLGVELEILTPVQRENIARYVQYVVNDSDELIYCKFDRSIGIGSNGREGEAGFEIVTHPMNFNWLRSEVGVNKINQIMDLKSFKCTSFHSNTCGMHVHLSKDAFTQTHLYKFLHMIFNNKPFSVMISERTDMAKVDRYANFTPEHDLIQLSIMKTNSGNETGRHKAVNLNPPNTVEVRIFRGTLNYSKFMKNIEYCVSLYEFTKDVSMKDLTVDEYKKFIVKNSKTYKHLHEFLSDKGELK